MIFTPILTSYLTFPHSILWLTYTLTSSSKTNAFEHTIQKMLGICSCIPEKVLFSLQSDEEYFSYQG